MERKFQFKRGPKSRLPKLSPAEMAFTDDEKKLYVGDGNENIRLLDQKDKTELTTALADTSSTLQQSVNSNSASTTQEGKIVFITDDGMAGDYTRLAPLFERKNMKLVFAVRTDGISKGSSGYMTLQNLKDLQSRGHEIMSHTYSHADLTTLNEQQIENEYKTSRNYLRENGIDCTGLAYPFGKWNDLAMKVARKYYECAYGTGREGYSINTPPIDQYAMARVTVVDDNAVGREFSVIQKWIDDVKKNKGLLAFCLHAFEFENTTQGNANFELLERVLDYINTQSIKVATSKEAMSTFGNLIDYGTFGKDYLKLSKTGNIATNNRINVIDSTEKNANSLPIHFDYGLNVYRYVGADASGFPKSPSGTLMVNKSKKHTQLTWQEWRPLDAATNHIYRRYATSDYVWGEWSIFRPVNISTYSIGDNSAPANAVMNIEVNVTGVAPGDIVVAVPTAVINDDLSWNAYSTTAGKVTLKIRNHNATIARYVSASWRISYQKA